LIIADSLGLSAQQKSDIRYGSWLHDCGKIGIPESVLNKPGKLTEEEMAIIRKHPDWGAEVARLANRSTTIVNIIRYHHESYDGTGYPTGIHGDHIPLEARIVTVADVFDALTSTRPYRVAFGLEEALKVMGGMRGKVLDPDLYDLFLKSPAARPAVDTTIAMAK
jgi:putative two-component system response regulator